MIQKTNFVYFSVQLGFLIKWKRMLIRSVFSFLGSAYKLSNRAAIHHGTIMLSVDTEALQGYLNPNKEKLLSKVTIRELLPMLAEYFCGIFLLRDETIKRNLWCKGKLVVLFFRFFLFQENICLIFWCIGNRMYFLQNFPQELCCFFYVMFLMKGM